MSSNLVNLGEKTKTRLEEIRDSNDHKSLDSVVKSLLKDRELVEVYDALFHDEPEDAFSYTPLTARPRPDGRETSPAHRVYVGAVGSGRHAVLADDIEAIFAQGTDHRVIYIDPFDTTDLSPVRESTGVTINTITAGAVPDVNPLYASAATLHNPSGIPAGGHRDRKVAEACWVLRQLLAMPALPDTTPDPSDPNVGATLETVISELYGDHTDADEFWPTLTDIETVASGLATGSSGTLARTAEELAETMAMLSADGDIFSAGDNLLETSDAELFYVSCGTESEFEFISAVLYFAECARAAASDVTLVIRDPLALGMVDETSDGWTPIETLTRHGHPHNMGVWFETESVDAFPHGVLDQCATRALFPGSVSQSPAFNLGRAEQEYIRNASLLPINDGEEGIVELLISAPDTDGEWEAQYVQL